MEETEKEGRPRKEKRQCSTEKSPRDSATQGAFEMYADEKASEVIPKSTSFRILGNKARLPLMYTNKVSNSTIFFSQ